MDEFGFYASNLEVYSSSNVSETTHGLLMCEFEAGDSGLRSMASVQGVLAMYLIHAYDNNEQKAECPQTIYQSEVIGYFGLTESAHGSNPPGWRPAGRENGGGYVLYDSQTWITNSSICTW